MPRTRNVTRSQWDAANAQRASTARASTRKENEGEKENTGRVATRSSTRAGTRRAALGAPAPLAVPVATKGKSVKGKGREQPPGKGSLTKTEKLPLQDITDRYLPAYEPANRGYEPQEEQEEAGGAQPDVGAAPPSGPSGSAPVRRRTRRAAPPAASVAVAPVAYPSSLPPSSPPSVSSAVPAPQPQQQPQEEETSDLPLLPPSPGLPTLSRRLFAVEKQDEPKPYDAWNEFDYAVRDSSKPDSRPPPGPHRTSDPFGFFALERKLQTEREEQGEEKEESIVVVEEDEVDEEAAGEILVADTSSPRPVRRLRHKYVIEAVAGGRDEGEEDDDGTPRQPPTPHKTVDRTRYSYGAVMMNEAHLFSPQASSCPSSPSPSKRRASVVVSPPSAKRKAGDFRLFDDDEDAYEEEESLSDLSVPSQKVPGRKQAKVESDDVQEGSAGVQTRRQLRSRSAQVHQKEAMGEASTSTSATEKKASTTTRKARGTRGDGTGKKGAAVKGKSGGKAKKVSNSVQEDSDMELWERERQRRLEYFRELEEYDYETENVYVV